jgi:hypothetical protein
LADRFGAADRFAVVETVVLVLGFGEVLAGDTATARGFSASGFFLDEEGVFEGLVALSEAPGSAVSFISFESAKARGIRPRAAMVARTALRLRIVFMS